MKLKFPRAGKHLPFVFGILAFTASAAWAVGPGSPAAGTVGGEAGVKGIPSGYQQFDLNEDGYLSKDELEKHREALSAAADDFDTYDKDSDGRLDREEFAAFEEEHGIGSDVSGQAADSPAQEVPQ